MRRLSALHDEIRAHGDCGVELCEACSQLVSGEGDPFAEVMLVGEAPGAEEDLQARPFVGSAGKVLDALLSEAGLERRDVYITNLLKARPPRNRDPCVSELKHHLPWLERQLALIQPKLIVALGRYALAYFAPGAKLAEVHGRLIRDGDRALFPMYHPAAALSRETLIADAQALGAALRET